MRFLGPAGIVLRVRRQLRARRSHATRRKRVKVTAGLTGEEIPVRRKAATGNLIKRVDSEGPTADGPSGGKELGSTR